MNRHNPSIQTRLLTGTVLAVALTILGGFFLIYEIQKESLTKVIDEELKALIDLQKIEVEIDDGKVTQEWLDHIYQDPIKTQRDLIQVWEAGEAGTEKTFKSPALGDFDLPKIHGELNQYVITDIELPDGRKGRAIGVLILPKNDLKAPVASLSGMEHIMVLSLETGGLKGVLRHLRQAMTWIFAITLILCVLAIVWTIKRSLKPILALENRLETREIKQLDQPIVIPTDFPRELHGLVSKYNRLLSRIEKVRIRERDFSTHAAHELRSPIAGIQATLEQAVSDIRDPQDYQTRIRRALGVAHEMGHLVNHLMRFAQLQNGTHPMMLEQINLHEILEATWSGKNDKAEKKQLQPRWELNSLGEVKRVDERLVRIFFSNLCDNAMSYAEPGTEITLSTHDQGNDLVLEVTNHSSAALPDDLEKLFEPFYRIDKARIAHEGHAGVGLSLCREIAHALGAEITLSSPFPRQFSVQVIFSANPSAKSDH